MVRRGSVSSRRQPGGAALVDVGDVKVSRLALRSCELLARVVRLLMTHPGDARHRLAAACPDLFGVDIATLPADLRERLRRVIAACSRKETVGRGSAVHQSVIIGMRNRRAASLIAEISSVSFDFRDRLKAAQDGLQLP